MTTRTPLPQLMVAPNGARRGKSDHPALPITIDQTVETAVACHRAGADGIHLHVRDETGAHSLDAGLYREALSAVGKAAPELFVQVTSEAAGRYEAQAQRAMIRELLPASVSVALREMIPIQDAAGDAHSFYRWADEVGISIQHILYTPDELRWFLSCIDDATVPGTHHQLQLVLGSYAGTELSRPSDLAGFTDLLEARQADLSFDWMLCAFGPAETSCLLQAAKQGGKMRVGFENSLWNADGSLARDNAQRVAAIRAALVAADHTLSPTDR